MKFHFIFEIFYAKITFFSSKDGAEGEVEGGGVKARRRCYGS